MNSSRDSLCKWLSWVDYKINSAEDECNHYLMEVCRARWIGGMEFARTILSGNTEQILGCVEIFNVSCIDKCGKTG